MQKLALAVALLVVLIMFIAEGFAPAYPMPLASEVANTGIYTQASEIETALTEIYFNVDIMGLKTATAESLAADFDTDTSLFSAVYGKYTDGRFGIADVIIVQPRYGRDEDAAAALQSIKSSRMNTFKSFDPYNATEISQNGIIFERGGYVILLMIDDQENVRSILESNIGR